MGLVSVCLHFIILIISVIYINSSFTKINIKNNSNNINNMITNVADTDHNTIRNNRFTGIVNNRITSNSNRSDNILSIFSNKTGSLNFQKSECYPRLKPCPNNKTCVPVKNTFSYKCQENNNSFENTTNSSYKLCNQNFNQCESNEICARNETVFFCRIATNQEQYICSKCKPHGHCIAERESIIKCKCKPQWSGDFCETACNRNCTIGTCILLTKDEYCKCPGKFLPSSNCTEERKEITEVTPKGSDPFRIDIFFAVFSVVVLIISFLLILLMWRKRFHFLMKIAYYFQPYMDKAEKQYDVFISYKSSEKDESWVKNVLFPKIEHDMGLKACVHFRDFIPGETISNNIIESIQNSRRTLLVLSNDYIQSEWTRMEYQVAQQEMLKLRHRIIPVILDDIEDLKIEDKNLKFILKTVTYIQWPSHSNSDHLENIFWHNLKKTLPRNCQMNIISP